MELTHLTALSPQDGRYAPQTDALRPLFSEYGLIHARIQIEIEWLLYLSDQAEIGEIPALSPDAVVFLRAIVTDFSLDDANEIKRIERATNHDVKAVEYFIKQRAAHHPECLPLLEFLHFACTSEDINNLAYALLLRTARTQVLLPRLNTLLARLHALARTHAATPMLARTHGQPASPTTVGKEFANFAYRLQRQRDALARMSSLGKFNGAVGNYNAHLAAYPELDWPRHSRQFVESLGLDWNPYTTQIEPHDNLVEFAHTLSLANTLLIDLCRDLWGYISLDYFKQKLSSGEVGSSTMPHKVNPIDFENAEGNLGLANALLGHFAAKLPISRWQRDLSDSTVLRNIGVALGYALIGYHACLRGLDKLEINAAALEQDLNNHWEVLAEAIQTVMRRHGLPEPYEQLKALTRGNRIDALSLHTFVANLALPDAVKARLQALTPATYTGLATQLAQDLP